MTVPSSSPSPQEPRLESWKEIAAYLSRDARTVRRWEQSEGLPVHRHRHLARSSVYAFPSELDAWRQHRKPESKTDQGRPAARGPQILSLAAMLLLAVFSAGGGRVDGPMLAADQATALTARQVWTVPAMTANFVSDISPDERFISYTDNGNLALHDVTTGQSQKLTTTAREEPPQEFASVSAFDRAGHRIAYAWFSGKEPRGQSLRVLELHGASDAQPKVLYQNAEMREIYPYDWTPDGANIVVGIVRHDPGIQVGLVSTRDGSLRVLKSMEWRVFGNMALSPDGRYLAVDLPETADTGARDVFVLSADGSRETAVAAGRGREVLIGWSPDGRQLLFESDRNGTGGVWAVPMADGRQAGEPALVKPDTGVMSALGITARGRLYYRSRGFPRETVRLGEFDFSAATPVKAPADLPAASRAFATHTPEFSPDGRYLAHLSSDYASAGQLPLVDQRITVRSLTTGQIHREIRPAPELEFMGSLRWSPDSRWFAVAGRNRRGRYGLFKIDAESGALTTIVLDDPGPAVAGTPNWSPDGTKLYYGKRFRTPAPGEVAIFEHDMATGTDRELYRRAGGPSGWASVSPDGRFIVTSPAANGRATAGTNALIAISTTDRSTRGLMPVTEATSARVVAWTVDGQSMFVGKHPDGGQPELWRVPLDGGTPARLGPFPFPDQISSLKVHRDGRQFAFVQGDDSPPAPDTVWVLENFLALPGKR